MISEGSCDTEDWSNDAENSALHHKLYYIFDKTNVVLISINTFQKHYRILLTPTFESHYQKVPIKYSATF